MKLRLMQFVLRIAHFIISMEWNHVDPSLAVSYPDEGSRHELKTPFMVSTSQLLIFFYSQFFLVCG